MSSADESAWNDLCDESFLKILDDPSVNQMNMNHSILRDDEIYRGFDNNAGSTWFYPNNYPVRQYQFNITKAALFRNTLVVLPTGLGKTFIAAVVMYNIYRWYPTAKIIFMAPTKPLVSQQVEACRKIVGIPSSDTVEITGKQSKKNRRDLWQSKRVFFVTPHVVQNDINDCGQEFPFDDIRLVVVDEAHKARGHYAHVEAVRAIHSRNPHFRVLALSATPGRNMEDVIEVIRNLYIAHLEVRFENSLDVRPYTFKKNIRTVVVPFGTDLEQIRNDFIDIVDPYVRYLIENQVLSGSMNSFSRGSIIMEQKRFREMSLQQKHPNETQVKTNFSICVSLYHALELLERHGVRVFLNFFDDPENQSSHRYYIATNPKLKDFLDKLRRYVGPNPFEVNDETMTNGKVPEVPHDLDFGHPKFLKAKEFLVEHFQKNEDSRAIVFCEYRESVVLMYRALLQNRPLIKPKFFVGQGGTGSIRAVTQKQQLEAMEQFRSGVCNTLVATSVAEEGIDVGEVDLIICFDISTKNPTRFVQRIGRTGRKRQGSIIMMATAGKEQSIIKDVLQTKDKLNQKIVNSSHVSRMLYQASPRIVPPEYNPKCLQLFMGPNDKDENQDAPKAGKSKASKAKAKGAKKANLSQNIGDVRKFFKRVDLDKEDRKVFSSSPPGTSRVSFAALEEDTLEVSNIPDKEDIWSKLEKLRNVHFETDPSKSFSKMLASTDIEVSTKRQILEANVEKVREKYEALNALKAGEEDEAHVLGDELSLQVEVVHIENILGQKIEIFLSKFDVSTKKQQFLEEIKDIFKGLERRQPGDDKEEFINEQLEKLPFKPSICFDCGFKFPAKETEDISIEAVPIEVDPIEVSDEDTQIELEHESRYLSQLTQFRARQISDQSTPMRPINAECNAKTTDGKELFPADCFEDDSALFGAFANVALIDVETKTENKIGETKPCEVDCDIFDDDFDDFIANNDLVKVVQETEATSQESERDINSCPNGFINRSESNSTLYFNNDKDDIQHTKSRKSSPVYTEACNYEDFFEPLDYDEIAALDEIKPNEDKKRNKSSSFDNTADNFGVSKHTSADLFKSFDSNLQTSYVGAHQTHNTSPHPTSPKSAVSPSVLTRKINIQQLRLTGSLSSVQNASRSSFLGDNVKSPITSMGNKSVSPEIAKTSSSLSEVDSPLILHGRKKRIIESDSDTEECSQVKNKSLIANGRVTKRRKLLWRKCEFIDDEANVSGDNEKDDHSEENSQYSQLQYDSVVVVDDDDDVEDHPDVDMRAKYLQSIRSPVKGAFKIPAPRVFNDMSRIFSQAVPIESSTIDDDSFVVHSDEEVSVMSQQCPLERAEEILKARRRERKKMQKMSGSNGNNCHRKEKFEMRNKNFMKRIKEISEEESDDSN